MSDRHSDVCVFERVAVHNDREVEINCSFMFLLWCILVLMVQLVISMLVVNGRIFSQGTHCGLAGG